MGQLAQGLCNDEKMRSNLESGSTYAYNYQGNDGSLIGEIELTIQECEDMDEKEQQKNLGKFAKSGPENQGKEKGFTRKLANPCPYWQRGPDLN